MPTSPETGRGDGAAGGELVEIAYGDSWVQAEMIQGLLENAGIPSLLRPAGTSLDGSGLVSGALVRGLGGGPQRVMVHAHRAREARDLLAATLVEDDEPAWPDADEDG